MKPTMFLIVLFATIMLMLGGCAKKHYPTGPAAVDNSNQKPVAQFTYTKPTYVAGGRGKKRSRFPHRPAS